MGLSDDLDGCSKDFSDDESIVSDAGQVSVQDVPSSDEESDLRSIQLHEENLGTIAECKFKGMHELCADNELKRCTKCNSFFHHLCAVALENMDHLNICSQACLNSNDIIVNHSDFSGNVELSNQEEKLNTETNTETLLNVPSTQSRLIND